jgi:hypothetical protein
MKTSIEIEDNLWKRAKVHCVMNGLDLKDLIGIALGNYLDLVEGREKNIRTMAKEGKKQ